MRTVVCGSVLLVASACASRPRGEPELVPPALQVVSGHHVGSLLAGATPTAAIEALDTRPEAALGYSLVIEYVERDPRAGLAPVAGEAELFATLRGGEPIAATGRLSTEARLARGAEARALAERLARREFGRTKELGRLDGALPSNVTATLSCAATRAVSTPADGPLLKSLRCELAREGGDGSGAPRIALVLEDLAPRPFADPREKPEESAAHAPEAPRVIEEALLFAAPVDGGASPLAFALPSPFVDGEGQAVVVFVDVRGPSNDAAAVDRALADCREALVGTKNRVQRVASAETRRKEFESALGSLDANANRRSALVFLAQATGARLAGDLALAADDATLDAYVQSLPRAPEQIAQSVVDGSTLGFVLERGAFAFLAARGAETPLAPELSGVLVRHAGEVGRSSGALDDLVANAKTVADLDRLVVEQNLIALEDTTLGVRVRAFDWLAARELAPKGYDPFADAKERRAALEAAAAESAESADSTAERSP
ncbi:MAG: hypothetical protein L6Q99_02240 [Planctomycetes bacterium]|nr:hypothetical protein [Planctomycetota bacterium]